jgi:eukaryotic-like serine/threonine-protein kinase
MLPAPGTLIAGKYRLERLLGEGGMGAVYAARHEVMQKPVALKWLKPQHGDERHARQRFLREARAAARIRHPNVVDVYDLGEDGAAMYMVMELLEGESLAAHLERTDVPLADTMRHILGAMRGVAAAHAVHITHRDIKPENVFIAHDPVQIEGVAKVLDFGIAKLHGDTLVGLSQAGVAIGTPHYMSLEQLTGAAVDQRADVYAFGVLLYRVITGVMPYDGESVSQIVGRAISGIIARPIDRVPDLPRALDRIVMRALARLRDDRFATLTELIVALEQVKLPSVREATAPLLTPPTTHKRRALHADPTAVLIRHHRSVR